MQEVLVNRLGGLSPPRKSVVRLTDRPDMTLDVYHGSGLAERLHRLSDKHFAATVGVRSSLIANIFFNVFSIFLYIYNEAFLTMMTSCNHSSLHPKSVFTIDTLLLMFT